MTGGLVGLAVTPWKEYKLEEINTIVNNTEYMLSAMDGATSGVLSFRKPLIGNDIHVVLKPVTPTVQQLIALLEKDSKKTRGEVISEIEKLYNDNKITKDELNRAKLKISTGSYK